MRTLILTMSILVLAAGCKPMQNSTAEDSVADNVEVISTSVESQSKSGNNLMDEYWKLLELNGFPVVIAEDADRQPHLILNSVDKRATGNAGCNSFGGGYELSGMHLKFSAIASTKMACLNSMTTETEFFQVLEVTDSYSLRNDTLLLNDKEKTVIAKLVKSQGK